MYCRLHMCSPVLRHITYIPHSIKLFFLHILKHFSTYKMSLSDYENKKSFRQSLGCYKHYNFNETKKYCSKRQMLNLSCAEEKLRGQSTCVLHISFFRVLLQYADTYEHIQSFSSDRTQLNTASPSIYTPMFIPFRPSHKKHEVFAFKNHKKVQVEELLCFFWSEHILFAPFIV